jgi:hypothetical protein
LKTHFMVSQLLRSPALGSAAAVLAVPAALGIAELPHRS